MATRGAPMLVVIDTTFGKRFLPESAKEDLETVTVLSNESYVGSVDELIAQMREEVALTKPVAEELLVGAGFSTVGLKEVEIGAVWNAILAFRVLYIVATRRPSLSFYKLVDDREVHDLERETQELREIVRQVCALPEVKQAYPSSIERWKQVTDPPRRGGFGFTLASLDAASGWLQRKKKIEVTSTDPGADLLRLLLEPSDMEAAAEYARLVMQVDPCARSSCKHGKFGHRRVGASEEARGGCRVAGCDCQQYEEPASVGSEMVGSGG